MPSSYTSLNYHIVFGTKLRQALLTESIREAVYKQITGIIQKKEGRLIRIGGIEDHVHILTTCSPKIALADFVRDIKASSSKWINEQNTSDEERFAWQVGYGAFTVSVSQIETVIRYIKNQAVHHRKQSFRSEFEEILIKHQIEFDKARLFDDEYHG